MKNEYIVHFFKSVDKHGHQQHQHSNVIHRFAYGTLIGFSSIKNVEFTLNSANINLHHIILISSVTITHKVKRGNTVLQTNYSQASLPINESNFSTSKAQISMYT